MTTLSIFDFDGTLFRSPMKPDDWKGGWWSKAASLSPPLVPESPDSEWWVGPTVTAAHAAIQDSGAYTVMLTGRPPPVKPRVLALLRTKGLSFDDTFFSTGTTLPFKISTINTLIDDEITRVEMWEDRTEHAGIFSELLRGKGIDFKIHLVNSTPMPPLVTPVEEPAQVRVQIARIVTRFDDLWA